MIIDHQSDHLRSLCDRIVYLHQGGLDNEESFNASEEDCPSSD